MYSTTEFITLFPQFGGTDMGSLESALSQALSEYSLDTPNHYWILYNLMAHILYVRSMAISSTVRMMGAANGQSSGVPDRATDTGGWAGNSLNTSPYGQEVLRLLSQVTTSIMFIG